MTGRELQRWLDEADALCAAGRYFEAHEELERAWRSASGAEKVLLQGVIQLAAGLHRLRRDPGHPAGARYLLERGLAKLRAHASLLDASSEAARARIERILARGKAPSALRLRLRVRRDG